VNADIIISAFIHTMSPPTMARTTPIIRLSITVCFCDYNYIYVKYCCKRIDMVI
jgi:hypothetical protein